MSICWIVLAAGRSTRFGENKLLYPFQGKPLYRHGYEQLKAAATKRKEPLIVVTSHREIADALSQEDVMVAWNDCPQKGITSSIKCGLSAAGGIQQDMVYLFAVADQPFLQTAELLCFAEAFLQSKKPLGCMAYEAQWGNPAIFSADMAKKLLHLQGDCGGKQILQAYPRDVFVYACQSHTTILDIDTKQDLEGI